MAGRRPARSKRSTCSPPWAVRRSTAVTGRCCAADPVPAPDAPRRRLRTSTPGTHPPACRRSAVARAAPVGRPAWRRRTSGPTRWPARASGRLVWPHGRARPRACRRWPTRSGARPCPRSPAASWLARDEWLPRVQVLVARETAGRRRADPGDQGGAQRRAAQPPRRRLVLGGPSRRAGAGRRRPADLHRGQLRAGPLPGLAAAQRVAQRARAGRRAAARRRTARARDVRVELHRGRGRLSADLAGGVPGDGGRAGSARSGWSATHAHMSKSWIEDRARTPCCCATSRRATSSSAEGGAVIESLGDSRRCCG